MFCLLWHILNRIEFSRKYKGILLIYFIILFKLLLIRFCTTNKMSFSMSYSIFSKTIKSLVEPRVFFLS